MALLHLQTRFRWHTIQMPPWLEKDIRITCSTIQTPHLVPSTRLGRLTDWMNCSTYVTVRGWMMAYTFYIFDSILLGNICHDVLRNTIICKRLLQNISGFGSCESYVSIFWLLGKGYRSMISTIKFQTYCLP